MPWVEAVETAHESLGADSERLIEMIERVVRAVELESVNLWDDPEAIPESIPDPDASLRSVWSGPAGDGKPGQPCGQPSGGTVR